MLPSPLDVQRRSTRRAGGCPGLAQTAARAPRSSAPGRTVQPRCPPTLSSLTVEAANAWSTQERPRIASVACVTPDVTKERCSRRLRHRTPRSTHFPVVQTPTRPELRFGGIGSETKETGTHELSWLAPVFYLGGNAQK